MDLFSLAGMTAVVTGGGGGVGRAAAEGFARAGADVALLGRNAEKLEQAAEAVREAGRNVIVVSVDVTSEDDVRRAAETVSHDLAGADILFNCAGVTSSKTAADMTLDEWRRLLDVNLTGAFLCVQAFAPGMAARGFGRVINMGSILSARGMATRTAYSASKAGLANFGAALAFELGASGVTVNTLAATVMITDLNRDLVRAQPELYDRIRARAALGRLGELDDIVGPLVFLASRASGFITGQTLFVDGGYTAG